MTNAEIARELVIVERGARGWEIRLPGVAGLAKLKTKFVPKTRAQAETAADYFRSHVRAILDRADRTRLKAYRGQKNGALLVDICERAERGEFKAGELHRALVPLIVDALAKASFRKATESPAYFDPTR